MHEKPYSQSKVADPFARHPLFSSPGKPPAAASA